MDDSQGDIETFRQWCRLNLLLPSLCPSSPPKTKGCYTPSKSHPHRLVLVMANEMEKTRRKENRNTKGACIVQRGKKETFHFPTCPPIPLHLVLVPQSSAPVGEGRPFPFRYSFAHDPVMMMMIRFHRASPLPGRSLKSLPIDHRHTIVEARSGGCVKSRWQMFIFLLSSYFYLFPFGLRFPPGFSNRRSLRPGDVKTIAHTHTHSHTEKRNKIV